MSGRGVDQLAGRESGLLCFPPRSQSTATQSADRFRRVTDRRLTFGLAAAASGLCSPDERVTVRA